MKAGERAHTTVRLPLLIALHLVPGLIFAGFFLLAAVPYVVMAGRNWRIGVVVHSMCNLWGALSLAILAT